MAGFTGLLDYFQQKSDRSDYKDLLQKYGYGPDQSQELGPVQNDMPGARFLMEASANPMFGGDILSQMQRNRGALDLQQQGLDWSKNNMSLYEAGNLDQNAIRLTGDQAHQRGLLANDTTRTTDTRNYQNTSLAQERENYLNQDRRDWARIRAERMKKEGVPTVGGYKPDDGKMWVQGPNGPTQAFLPGSKGARDNSLILNNLINGIGSIDEYMNYLDNYGTHEIFNTEAKGRGASNFQNIISARAALGNSGVVQPGELPRLSAGLVDPMNPGWNPFKRKSGAKGSASQTKIDLQNKIADMALQNPELVTPEIQAKIAPILAEREKYLKTLQGKK